MKKIDSVITFRGKKKKEGDSGQRGGEKEG